MSAHVLSNLLNVLGKRDKMRGLPSILSLLLNGFNKFNNTRARMFDSIYLSYDINITLKSHFCSKNDLIRNVVMDVVFFPKIRKSVNDFILWRFFSLPDATSYHNDK